MSQTRSENFMLKESQLLSKIFTKTQTIEPQSFLSSLQELIRLPICSNLLHKSLPISISYHWVKVKAILQPDWSTSPKLQADGFCFKTVISLKRGCPICKKLLRKTSALRLKFIKTSVFSWLRCQLHTSHHPFFKMVSNSQLSHLEESRRT